MSWRSLEASPDLVFQAVQVQSHPHEVGVHQRHRDEADEHGQQHGARQLGAVLGDDHLLRVQGPPPQDGEVDDGHVEEGDDAQHRGEAGLAVRSGTYARIAT